VLANGVVNDCLLALSASAISSSDGDADNWGAGGGGIANLSCSCLDNVDAAGATVGNSMLPAVKKGRNKVTNTISNKTYIMTHT